MAHDVRLATKIDPAVDRRLRMLWLLEGGELSGLLTAVLDRALPPAETLAGRLVAQPQNAQAR
jgi:hypothetical protein